MKKNILKSIIDSLTKELVKTKKDLKVLKSNYKVIDKDRLHALKENGTQRGKLNEALEENKWLVERNKSLESFVQKIKCGFSVYYQYHHDDGTVEYYPIAQNIKTEEDAKQIYKIYENGNKDSHVYYAIASPEIKY